MMEAVSTSVNFYETTQRNNPEDGNFHTRRHENLKSHLLTTTSQISKEKTSEWALSVERQETCDGAKSSLRGQLTRGRRKYAAYLARTNTVPSFWISH
jgi:hypothetical protein